MKKTLVAALAVIALAGFVSAGSLDNVAKTKTVAVTASGTTYTNTVDFVDLYKSIEKIVLLNTSAVTVTAVTYAVSGRVAQTIDTSVITAGSSAVVQPVQAFSNGSTTNRPYLAQKVRTIFTLAGTNGTANATALEETVYGYAK